jgi:hypothetical protein
MTVQPRTSDGAMRDPLSSLLAAAVACAALLSPASAQSARSGIRLEYTAIDTQGGMAGRGFLPMSSRDVVTGAASGRAPCSGALLLRATARQTRGAIRQVTLTIAVRTPAPTPATLPLDATACPGGFVDTTLEDGSVLSGGRGEVVVTAVVQPGQTAGYVSGTFSQTALRNSTPVTIRGEFRIPLPLPPASATRSSGAVDS